MIRKLVFGLLTAASLYGQGYGHPRFNWQNYCFDHPAAPVCPSHEFYDKRPAPAKAAPPPSVVTNPFPSPREASPSLIVVGGIDWRFADPSADALVGFNFSALSASPLACRLIAQLGADQGLTGVDMQKILDGLSGVDQVALSVRDNRIVIMVTSGTGSKLPTLEAGWKAVPVSGNVMLIGHADAVDEAVRRIAMKGPLAEPARLSEERQTNNEFWAVGSVGFAGAQAVNAGLRRFSLTVSIRNRLASDLDLEFNGAPNAGTLRIWPALDGGTIEGNVVHFRMSDEADEVQRRPRARPTALEFVAQRELHGARVHGAVELPEGQRRLQVQARVGEVRMIERIESFRAKLNSLAFPGEPEYFRERER